jgi:hypothetical protein
VAVLRRSVPAATLDVPTKLAGPCRVDEWIGPDEKPPAHWPHTEREWRRAHAFLLWVRARHDYARSLGLTTAEVFGHAVAPRDG